MFLTIFVCALAGMPCKPLPLPAHLEAYAFASLEECQDTGLAFEQAWLLDHTDLQEGGVRCTAEKLK